MIDFPDPILRNPGEPLDPLRHSAEALAHIQQVSGPRTWGSLWQQTPAVKAGQLIKREWFKVIPLADVPSNIKWARAWDLAYTAAQINKPDPDYTVGIKGGVCWLTTETVVVIISDMRIFRKDWHEVKQEILTTANLDGKHTPIGVGYGGAKATINDLLTMPELMGYSIRAIPEIKDKVARTSAWRSRAEVGLIQLVEGPWNESFFQWCEVFPNGAHDDVPDDVSILWEMFTTEEYSETIEHAAVEQVRIGEWD